MKDYSSYYSSLNDIILNSANYIFNKKLETNEGFVVDIDDNKNIQVVIQEHSNPLNEDKEDRKIFIPSSISFHRGSIVSWKDRKWIITNNVGDEDKNNVYSMAKIYPCNNTLKFILPSDHIKIIEIPCITSNMSLYSIGLEEQKQIIMSDGKKFCIVPFDDYTNEVFIKQRFLFWDKQCFEITEINYDKASIVNDIKQGILEIKMQQVELLPEDNLGDFIAYNEGISLESPLPEKTIIINGDYKLYLSKTREYTVTYEDGTPITDKTFTFSFADTSLATIQSYTNTSAVLKANSSLKGYGDLVVYDESNNIVTSKSIWVRSLI